MNVKQKLIADTGGGCSICAANPVVNVEGTYWLCGPCVNERTDISETARDLIRLALPIMIRRIDRYAERAKKQKSEFWAQKSLDIARESEEWSISARYFLDTEATK